MSEGVGALIISGIIVLLLAAVISLTVWHNIDVNGRVQMTCIAAGGQWQNNTCIRVTPR